MRLEKLMKKFHWRGVILISTTGVLTVTLPSLAVNLKADYRFQNNLSSFVSGAPNLVDLGSTNTFGAATVDSQSTTVFNFAQQTGLQVSTAGLIPNNQYTVVLLFEFDNVSGYRKILDFKNGSSDTGLYNLSSDLDFFPAATGSGTPITPNTYVQVALTRQASNLVTVYVNGVQQFSFSDSGNLAEISSSNFLTFLETMQRLVGESSAGSVARIRLYDDVLSSVEITALDRLPAVPSTSVPEPSAVLGLGILGFAGLLKRTLVKAK